MISRTSKGTRRTRIVLWTAALLVVAFCSMLVWAHFGLERQRMNSALAREAQAAATERRAKQAQAVEQARTNLPANAPIPKTWSLGASLPQYNRLLEPDMGLLKLLLDVYLSHKQEKADAAYESLCAGVKAAVDSNKATPFAREVAAHAGSRNAVLTVVGNYLRALAPLNEIEQAMNAGLPLGLSEKPKDSGVQDPSSTATIYLASEFATLAVSLLSLRGLAETQAGDTESAFLSCVCAYRIGRTRMEDEESPYLWTMFQRFQESPDLLMERIVDRAWRESPWDERRRKQAVECMAWHPDWSLITQTLRLTVDARDPFGEPSATGISSVEHIARIVMRPVVFAKSADMLDTVSAAVGKHPREIKDRCRSLQDALPRSASWTRILADSAFAANERFWARETKGDVARLAFALKDYKRIHGAYPETLQGPEFPPLPQDWSKDAPLEYRSDTKTFIIARPNVHGGESTVWEARE